MTHLPIFVNLKGRNCLVVGGGEVAARKITRLLKADAHIRVVAPDLCPALRQLHQQEKISCKIAGFNPDDLDGCWLVIAATDNSELNQQVSSLAEARRIPVNVVDNPDLCTFIMPSIIDRDPVQIAISTGGASPVLARLLRSRLESTIPAAYGQLASLMASFRDRVKKQFGNSGERRRFWESILQGPVAEMLFAGQDSEAVATLERALKESPRTSTMRGEVYLVGAGPGDPDLLTFRALRLMQQADIVLYDRLVAPEIVDLARRDAERIYVGKKRDRHSLPQENINELLVRLAREGKRVLRLKGGDPFIFGRGGEEIETLSAQGVPFQVVPGITAASGCASYAGIPLTHRDYAQSCVFVTGHLRDGTVNLNWGSLVAPGQTIVIYMGLVGLEFICAELIAHGMPDSMPIALVQQGTTRYQKVFCGTLASLPDTVKQKNVQAPTLVIVGEVVRLRDKLAWFEPVPSAASEKS